MTGDSLFCEIRNSADSYLSGRGGAGNGLRGNDRHPKGRDAERLGCACAGERDPTSGRGPPKDWLVACVVSVWG